MEALKYMEKIAKAVPNLQLFLVFFVLLVVVGFGFFFLHVC